MGGQFLQFLYMGTLEPEALSTDASALAVLRAAHRHEVTSLVEICAKVISGRLAVQSVTEVLQTADLIGCTSLRERCLGFVTTHLAEVQDTDGFRRLLQYCPELFKDLFSMIAPPRKKRRLEPSVIDD